MLSRQPTGGRARLFDGLVSLTQEEKVRLSSREALAASAWDWYSWAGWSNLAGGGLKAKIAKTAGYVAFDGVRYFWCEQTEERLSGREHLVGVQREIKTRCVGQVKTEKLRLSGREHLACVHREIKTRRVGQVKTEESKIVWPGAPRQRPTGD